MATKQSYSRFMANPSPAFIEAVAALKKVLETEGVSSAMRVYAEVVSDTILQQSTEGLKQRADDHVCRYRLQGRVKCPDSCDKPCDSPDMPGRDHITEWVKDGKTESIISQPYSMPFETLVETVKYCQQHGLRADITSGDSWHFPGATLKVEYKRAEDKSSRKPMPFI